MRSERQIRRPRAALLAIALAVLWVEVFAFSHPLDAQAHDVGEACKICLALGALGSMDVGKAAQIPAVAHSPEPGTAIESVSTSPTFISHRARAPPPLS